MRCENCGEEGASLRQVTRTLGKGPELLVVENVPMVACSRCGESYLTADTLRTLEDLRIRGREAAEVRTVGVIRFDAA